MREGLGPSFFVSPRNGEKSPVSEEDKDNDKNKNKNKNKDKDGKYIYISSLRGRALARERNMPRGICAGKSGGALAKKAGRVYNMLFNGEEGTARSLALRN